MFVSKHYLVWFSVFLLFGSYDSKSIRDDKYFELFVVNPTTDRARDVEKSAKEVTTEAVPKTTYDWGQWTKTEAPVSATDAPGSKTTYDWGQHTATGSTYDWGQHTATDAPGSRTTYDWGQHTATGAPSTGAPATGAPATGVPSTGAPATGVPSTGAPATEAPGSRTTYDWGQHTATGSTYDWGQHTATDAPGSRTTYDWGQHTATGSTYDWGQHTATGAPGSRTTYDWGQHTATGSTYDWGQHTATNAPGSRTTYDWGQHTKTSSPNEDNSTATDNPNDGNEYRCPAGKYTCKGTIGLCISLSQICDGKQDCPHRDDEDKKICFPDFAGKPNNGNGNNFAGTGFMFHIKNIVVKDGSDVRLFDQQSDNKNTRLVLAQN